MAKRGREGEGRCKWEKLSRRTTGEKENRELSMNRDKMLIRKVYCNSSNENCNAGEKKRRKKSNEERISMYKKT